MRQVRREESRVKDWRSERGKKGDKVCVCVLGGKGGREESSESAKENQQSPEVIRVNERSVRVKKRTLKIKRGVIA